MIERMNMAFAGGSKTNTPRRPVLPPVARVIYRPRTGTGSMPVAESACSIPARVSRRSVKTSPMAAIMSVLVITGSLARSAGSMPATSVPARRWRWNGEYATACASNLRRSSRWAASIRSALQDRRSRCSGIRARTSAWKSARKRPQPVSALVAVIIESPVGQAGQQGRLTLAE